MGAGEKDRAEVWSGPWRKMDVECGLRADCGGSGSGVERTPHPPLPATAPTLAHTASAGSSGILRIFSSARPPLVCQWRTPAPHPPEAGLPRPSVSLRQPPPPPPTVVRRGAIDRTQISNEASPDVIRTRNVG